MEFSATFIRLLALVVLELLNLFWNLLNILCRGITSGNSNKNLIFYYQQFILSTESATVWEL